jgi:hypothetical protein
VPPLRIGALQHLPDSAHIGSLRERERERERALVVLQKLNFCVFNRVACAGNRPCKKLWIYGHPNVK